MKYKRILSPILGIGLMLGSLAGVNAQTISNPYESVNWSSYNSYKTALHMHSTFSDGSHTRKAMLEDMYAKGFNIVTMNDHNWTTTSWTEFGNGSNSNGKKLTNDNNTSVLPSEQQVEDWANGVGRDGKPGMIGLPNTNEQSQVDHINTFFVDYDQNGLSGTTIQKMEQTFLAAQDGGGISHINHPGRETGGSAGGDAGTVASNKTETIQKYTNFFNDFESIVGMEIINKLDNESRSERILWDNILKQTMPQGITVYGFANDDSHSLDATGYAWNELLMPELNAENARTAMETGTFYSVSRIDRREGINATLTGGGSVPGNGTTSTLYMLEQPTPSITDITVSGSTISITAQDYDVVEWIADGEKIATGNSIDIAQHITKISSYVRAQIKSTTGIAYTQAFGVELPEVKKEDANVSSFNNKFWFHERTSNTIFNEAFDMTALSEANWKELSTAIGFGEANGELLNGTKPGNQFSLSNNIPQTNPRYTESYFKKSFDLPNDFDPNTLADVSGTHRIDDNLIIYVNGIEVYRYNIGTVNNANTVEIGGSEFFGQYRGYNSDATSRDFNINSDYNNHETGFKSTSSGNPIIRDAASLTNLKKALKGGKNVLTCVVGQNSSNSSDLWFDIAMNIKYNVCDNHIFGEWVITQEPTCTETGNKNRTCILCGKIENEEIPELGHSWGEYSEWTIDVAATCTEEGSKSRTRNCTRECGEIDIQTEVIAIDPNVHSWGEYGEWTIDVAATCSEKGSKSRTRSCERECGATDKETEEIAIDPNAHNWSEEWTVVTPATCQTAGVEKKICQHNENHVQIQSIQQLTEGCADSAAIISELEIEVLLLEEDVTKLLDSIDILLEKLENCGTVPVIPKTPAGALYGIRFKQNIVSDKAEISVILPNSESVISTKIMIYDMTGNVVCNTSIQGANTIWDLSNTAGRNVANGTYLVIAECVGAGGVNYQYSAKLGVKK